MSELPPLSRVASSFEPSGDHAPPRNAPFSASTVATRFVPFRAGGEWHLWWTGAVVAIALVALAFSVFVVYLLEIVKLANPRVRRRRAGEADDERLSA